MVEYFIEIRKGKEKVKRITFKTEKEMLDYYNNLIQE